MKLCVAFILLLSSFDYCGHIDPSYRDMALIVNILGLKASNEKKRCFGFFPFWFGETTYWVMHVNYEMSTNCIRAHYGIPKKYTNSLLKVRVC